MSRKRATILFIVAMFLLGWLPFYEALENRSWLFLIIYNSLVIVFAIVFNFLFPATKEKARKN